MPTITFSLRARVRALVAALALAGMAAWAAGGGRAAAQAATCDSAVGPSGYTVTVCLTLPAAGATVQGVVPVQGTAAVTGSSNPGVKGIWFYLANAAGNAPRYVLQDLTGPYEWLLPSAYYVDKAYTLQAEVQMNDGFKLRVGHAVTLQNGVSSPPVNPNSFTPHAPAGPVTVAAVGDGAGSEPGVEAVSSMIVNSRPDLFLYLGDVYQRGTYAEFYNWYGTPDRNYGRLRAITNPIVGNHEYGVSGAADYFYWWDNVPHYYSYDAGGWHFVALDSTDERHFNQVALGTAQFEWLAADLAANALPCTLVHLHHPRFSIGPQKDDPRLDDLWKLLADRGVDVLLAGHEHQYQRWLPLDRDGNLAGAGGLAQFIVGTGGYDLQRPSPKTERVAFVTQTDGALFLDLGAGRADFRFVNTAGETLDAGTVECSGGSVTPTPTPTTTPTATPTGTATVTPTPTGTPAPPPAGLDEKAWLPLVGGD